MAKNVSLSPESGVSRRGAGWMGKGEWGWFSEPRSPEFIPHNGNQSPDCLNQTFQGHAVLCCRDREEEEEEEEKKEHVETSKNGELSVDGFY